MAERSILSRIIDLMPAEQRWPDAPSPDSFLGRVGYGLGTLNDMSRRASPMQPTRAAPQAPQNAEPSTEPAPAPQPAAERSWLSRIIDLMPAEQRWPGDGGIAAPGTAPMATRRAPLQDGIYDTVSMVGSPDRVYRNGVLVGENTMTDNAAAQPERAQDQANFDFLRYGLNPISRG